MREQKPKIGDLVMLDEDNNKFKTPWQNQLGIVTEMRGHGRCVITWIDGLTSVPQLRILEVLNESR